ncbi:MAG TPA: ATP-binding protein, partial [Gemmatimonadaceae bacterium]
MSEATGATTRRIEREVARALRGRRGAVLAVSGGIDSMVLLEAAARAADRPLRVAAFDHATGAHAAAAAELAASRAAELGLEAVVGRAAAPASDEAGLRAARWRFLRDVSRAADA